MVNLSTRDPSACSPRTANPASKHPNARPKSRNGAAVPSKKAVAWIPAASPWPPRPASVHERPPAAACPAC
eukprot:scaffold21431_cov101-Isochrysis_galbana.AAC.4